jgi:methionine-rich copper-binding protein CopC
MIQRTRERPPTVFQESTMPSPTSPPRRFSLVASAVALLLALGAALAFPQAVLSHAKPVSSTPAAGSTVKEAPSTVAITFGQNMKQEGSNIRVFDTKGADVTTGKATVDPNDLKEMSVGMKNTDSEEYVVLWNTISADDDEAAAGSFTFSVNPNGAANESGASSGGASSGVQP